MKPRSSTSLIMMRLHLIAAILCLAAIIPGDLNGMPPHPGRYAEEIAKGTPLPYYLAHREVQAGKGLNFSSKILSGLQAPVSGSFNALAVVIRFSDKDSSVAAAEFDTLIFVDQQRTVRNYYREISYNQLDVVTVNLPSATGWVTAPQTYAYYCNGQNGTGSYPQNCQKLCEDVVDLINPMVNFADYDNDNDGFVDALILVHTGPGAEFTWSDNDIWSHKWGIMPRLRDGVYISDYCIQPEYWSTPGDITCGVFCHELGHIFGLGDLYDTDEPRDAYGVGRWSLMSFGSWNGPTNRGESPAHLDAWSRIQLGFAGYSNISSNTNGVSIAEVENGGSIYRLWSGGAIGTQYFLVENRQKTGYDAYLPADGLLIWHIDETQADNSDQWYPGHISSGHYKVALEQADGLFELEKNISVGNGGDPFPGSTGKTAFAFSTSPNSNTYAGDITYVSVSDISASGAVMTADFQVALSSDMGEFENEILPSALLLGQNYPNPFNLSTRWEIALPQETDITVTIHDILGRQVRGLHAGYAPAGTMQVIWDGRDDGEKAVASGVYFYRLRTEYGVVAKTMVLMK